jgi:hypothetical protein
MIWVQTRYCSIMIRNVFVGYDGFIDFALTPLFANLFKFVYKVLYYNPNETHLTQKQHTVYHLHNRRKKKRNRIAYNTFFSSRTLIFLKIFTTFFPLKN